ncbi:electron transporter SCO1/SenC [Gluconacetobacter liquefaciens]|uniref:Protein SCO1/2 n=1 Tax=Gluconacetobacter liquefaciens TaxID=89584 RepID=A0A370G189_GLULI|nr:SCO family protein [Gluconacetobacter liquefaciens]MBB2186950.1 SCO family protein [Gluconacetobacter liquefaciens]RDI37631.1 protein SCO1/2 [Gluconacetobacter liquefaciens]GBQ98591.1 electron transport transmembrane protein SenC/PrrC [Gluconacetobacter liquefaciens NRIC 0522]GEB37162.1 electron transporter SCO1/SenC [Gluconacetobacter liquefaciens]
MQKRDKRRLAIGAVITVLSAAGGYAGYWAMDRAGPLLSTHGNEIGGSFRLVSAAEGEVSDSNFRGRWMLVYFGYTHCPDEQCGATLRAMAGAMDLLGPKHRSVAPLFISVDPMRDTAEAMRAYTLRFGPRIFAMTGAPTMLKAVTAEYHAPYVRHEGKDGDYSMEPSPRIVIMSPEGRYAGTIQSDASAQDIADRLNGLMAAQ